MQNRYYNGLLLKLCVLALMVAGVASGVAGTNYYSELLSSVVMAKPCVQRVVNPQLLDTNNMAFKTSNQVFRFDTIKTGGPMADIRLGMTMDEVVDHWGKPLELWWNYQGGVRLDYKEVLLYFATNTLTGICVNSKALRELRFEPSLKPRASLQEWRKELQSVQQFNSRMVVQIRQVVNEYMIVISSRSTDRPVFQLRLENASDPKSKLRPYNPVRLGMTNHPPCDKVDAAVIAKLAAMEQGYWWGEHKDPDPKEVISPKEANCAHWLVYFENKVPTPDSGLLATIDVATGEVVVDVE